MNWLCVCADYLTQDHRGDKFAQNFFEIMANKQTIEREKTFACKKLFYDHIYTFNELDYFSSLQFFHFRFVNMKYNLIIKA